MTLLAILCPLMTAAETVETLRSYAFATHHKPKYPPDFRHHDYVNPDTPKGGKVRLFDVAPSIRLIHTSLWTAP